MIMVKYLFNQIVPCLHIYPPTHHTPAHTHTTANTSIQYISHTCTCITHTHTHGAVCRVCARALCVWCVSCVLSCVHVCGLCAFLVFVWCVCI